MKITHLSLLIALAQFAACAGDKDGATDTGATDADTDTDTDSDTDADADTDADSDADTDTGPFGGDYVFATDPPSAYVRVDRMGMPAVATAVITSKDAYNAANPTDDAAGTFVGEIVGSVQFLHSALDDDLLSLSLAPCGPSATDVLVGQCIDQAAPYVVPDELTIDVTGTAGFPNGRKLEDPVIDITLALILLDLSLPPPIEPLTTFTDLPLNPPANDVAFTKGFPYLAPSH